MCNVCLLGGEGYDHFWHSATWATPAFVRFLASAGGMNHTMPYYLLR